MSKTCKEVSTNSEMKKYVFKEPVRIFYLELVKGSGDSPASMVRSQVVKGLADLRMFEKHEDFTHDVNGVEVGDPALAKRRWWAPNATGQDQVIWNLFHQVGAIVRLSKRNKRSGCCGKKGLRKAKGD